VQILKDFKQLYSNAGGAPLAPTSLPNEGKNNVPMSKQEEDEVEKKYSHVVTYR
jgi:hypothetical protein